MAQTVSSNCFDGLQPWGYIKALAVGDEEVEEEAKQNDEGRGQPKPPAARMGEDTKAKMEEGDEGDNDKEEGKEDGDYNGDGENNKDDDGESKKDDSKEADSKEDSKDDKKEEESGKKKE